MESGENKNKQNLHFVRSTPDIQYHNRTNDRTKHIAYSVLINSYIIFKIYFLKVS